MNRQAKDPLIFCAADTGDMARAHALSKIISRTRCGLKLGLEFFTAQGPEGVRALRHENPDTPVFLDLKFHDIPNTAAQAVRAAVPLGVSYINLHAAGGAEMMRAAARAVKEESARLAVTPPRILAVTVLTSLDDDALKNVGQAEPAAAQVERLALLSRASGMDGVVCSPQEIETLRAACGPDFILMVPGIRPAGTDAQDQKRRMTPAQALAAGATHLVIGRPVTGAPDPETALRAILDGLSRNGTPT